MGTYATKNYTTDGGDTMVIGGKLQVKAGAEVEGLADAGSISPATASNLGRVKVGAGLAVTEEGILSVAGATTEVFGGMKQIPYTADFSDTELTDFVSHFNQLLAALRTAGIMAPDTSGQG